MCALWLGGLLASAPLYGEEAAAQLSGAEPARYLSELKRLYLTQDDRQALLAHGNELLRSYALRAGYQVGQASRQDRLYQLRLGESGELLLREELRSEQGTDIAVQNRRLPLYGVDPFIRYECPQQGIHCVLYSPVDGSPLLSIVRDRQGAAELAKALSFLIRNLQKS